MISGNRGEWSEIYVLVRLLADGKLYAADSELRKINNACSLIKSIIRQEDVSSVIEYRLGEKKDEVVLYWNGDKVKSLSAKRLTAYAEAFYEGIIHGSKAAFHIKDAEKMMEDIKCSKIKAPSSDKTDIKMKIHDQKTGYESNVGFSIKSELGNPPTLLNAARTTNFRYEVLGLCESDIEKINGIYDDKQRPKVRDRITEIERLGSLKFEGATKKEFAGNLMLIDSLMEDIIAHMLLEYYKNGKVFCSDIATSIEKKDPMGYHREGIYRHKIKKFLCAVALGMIPSRKWDGLDEANGGYIVVKKSGEVLAYHLYNRNSFENYLLNNTRLDTGSTSKHQFGVIFEENGKQYINLNLQVRFV